MLRSTRAAAAALTRLSTQPAQHRCSHAVASAVVELDLPGHQQRVKLAYATYGEPGNPCILHPTSFDAKNDGRRHKELEYNIGPGATLDTARFFVVVPNLLGAGLSSSPSTELSMRPFPRFTIGDNVAAQHALLQRLGVARLALCYGYSMGAMQALTWATTHPGLVDRVVATCGTASCQPYNAVFLESLLAVLGEEPRQDARQGASVDAERRRVAKLRAFGRVYAGWGLPAEWYARRRWADHGYTSLEDFLKRSWEAWTVNAHIDDLRAQLHTWRAAAIGGHDARGELDTAAEAAALGRISARVLYLASAGDRYFPLSEARAEAALVGTTGGGSARVEELSLEWGHRAGDPHRPGQEADAAHIRTAVHALLAEGA